MVAIANFVVISFPEFFRVYLLIVHVIERKVKVSSFPVLILIADDFMDRPKPYKFWCCVPQCMSDGRKLGRYAYMNDVNFYTFPGEQGNPK